MKKFPKIGEKLYLSRSSGDFYCDMVCNPYTVVEIKGESVYVQACKLIFNGVRYFDTLPDDIREDKEGKIVKLRWSEKHQRWQTTGSCPEIATFGEWIYQPYLN